MATPTDPNAPSAPPLADVAPDPGPVDVVGPLPAGANLLGRVELDDGSGRIVAVKAGATAAGAADKALVVAQSPNSPTPAGANHVGSVTVDSALPAGTNHVGKVEVDTALPAGTNTIGKVDVNPIAPLSGAAPGATSVGVASAVAVAANAARRGLVLTNTSANAISIAFGGNAAVLGSGITIMPSGQWVMTKETFSQEAINAIAAGAASNLGIQEFA